MEKKNKKYHGFFRECWEKLLFEKVKDVPQILKSLFEIQGELEFIKSETWYSGDITEFHVEYRNKINQYNEHIRFQITSNN